MFQHFGQRLKRDIKAIVDRRLEASAIASGSQQRVRLPLFVSVIMAHPFHSVFWCRS